MWSLTDLLRPKSRHRPAGGLSAGTPDGDLAHMWSLTDLLSPKSRTLSRKVEHQHPDGDLAHMWSLTTC